MAGVGLLLNISQHADLAPEPQQRIAPARTPQVREGQWVQLPLLKDKVRA
jgi:hypothetical protein